MKYSILITYYNRPMLHNTLLSYRHFYADRGDYEILVLEDKKNVEDPVKKQVLQDILAEYKDLPIRHIPMHYDNFACPCSTMNYGVALSNGEYVVLTSPECYLATDALAVFDAEFKTNSDLYLVAACAENVPFANVKLKEYVSWSPEGMRVKWRQHSMFQNRLLNWFSAIKRSNYIQLGGFNEEYDLGLGRADVEFVKRVAQKHAIHACDDALVLHIDHGREFCDKSLVNKNYSVRTFKSRFANGVAERMT